ncbi:MAG: hypothetical protein ABJX35_01670 [Hyphomicrobiales bacterium]
MSTPLPRVLVTKNLEWNKSSVWVADATPLKEKKTPDGPRYIKPSGETVEISEEDLNQSYYSFNNGELLKPHLNPEQSIYFADEIDVVFDDGKALRAQDFALILSDTGDVRMVDGPQYKREYKVVGYRGAERPTTQFSSVPRSLLA